MIMGSWPETDGGLERQGDDLLVAGADPDAVPKVGYSSHRRVLE